jgi:large subunit ribosomal protein L24
MKAKQEKNRNKKQAFHIRKNDLVEVITGEENERRGRVLEVIPENAMAIVEGVNLVKKHQRARSQAKPSGIVTVPAPVHVSNLVLICPRCGKKAKVRMEKIENKRVRICKKCGESIE